jgi:uncharacterized protein YutE (UPF0331/DUF86 family)
MVDPKRVQALLDRLEEESSHLRRLAERDAGDLLDDPDALAAVKYRLVIGVEVCIDIGHHVISSEGLRAPDDFADVFASLAEGGFLPKEMIEGFQEMARFRNLLVHVYERVDDRRVVEILKSRLGDFDRFREQVARTALGE